MAKRRDKKMAKEPLQSEDKAVIADQPEKDEGVSATVQEVERQIAALKAIAGLEFEQLITHLRVVRSYFSEEQQQIPALQFFKENLPNLSIARNSEDGNFDLKWKDDDGNLSAYDTQGRDINASLLHHMSLAYPTCSDARQSFAGGLQFSAMTVKSDDLQIGNYLSQDSLNTIMLGMPEGLQTPGASSQRMSVGMTQKSARLPKPGEMLLSVHGSPLGVFKEDNMEAIHESEEG